MDSPDRVAPSQIVCVSLHLLIFPCTMKFRSSLLALAHPGGPGKRAVKRLRCVCVFICLQCFDAVGCAAGRTSSL